MMKTGELKIVFSGHETGKSYVSKYIELRKLGLWESAAIIYYEVESWANAAKNVAKIDQASYNLLKTKGK